jgi:hypothetical protein
MADAVAVSDAVPISSSLGDSTSSARSSGLVEHGRRMRCAVAWHLKHGSSGLRGLN